MSAPQLDLKGRPLRETLAQLQQQVRQQPGDAKLRVFLFQLLAALGQWERALTQLGVTGEMDVAAMAMVHTYREAVKCEALRAEVFAGRRTPVVFGEPENWAALLMEALRLSAAGEHAKAAELRATAFEQAPATPGRVITRAMEPEGDDPPKGEPFEWIADADSRMGPMLEAIVLGRYLWIPFQRLQRVQFEPVEDLRDLVWIPAHLTWANGGEQVALLPVRYSGTEASEDDALLLARKTDWAEVAPGTHSGLGQRLLATDQADYGLLELRSLELAPAGA